MTNLEWLRRERFVVTTSPLAAVLLFLAAVFVIEYLKALVEVGSDTLREALNIMTMVAMEYLDVLRLPTLADMTTRNMSCAVA
ncbi:hypothetical protein CDEST_03239 [Colletotrichum destructivum]|uniref:Uncharacterized protein n=1 Tax=Colletotrichum destructivum TaxID=34406 RepID=A0AAX4I5F3_9PEZI|nr:hypothetical protein CDEST_03239 [Colletotrichum destructivum]